MKIFQKTYLLVGMMLFCGKILGAVDSEQIKVMRLISRTYAEVFMLKNNLFAEKIKDKDFINWGEMLDKVKNYVDANAGGNKKLLDTYSFCKNFSDQLFSTISKITNSVFSEKIPPGTITKGVRSELNKLDSKSFRFGLKITMLTKTKFYIYAQKKNNVKEVLLHLMKILEPALRKTWGDFENQLGLLERRGGF